MAIKTYLLTIEYNDETEEVEYIQEEILGKEPEESKGEVIVNIGADLKFDKETLELIRKYYSGEIGES
tara:strand:+ start:1921 stop:2124 length:204 start_codon:yes stop_codon:yes gene_type:complete